MVVQFSGDSTPTLPSFSMPSGEAMAGALAGMLMIFLYAKSQKKYHSAKKRKVKHLSSRLRSARKRLTVRSAGSTRALAGRSGRRFAR